MDLRPESAVLLQAEPKVTPFISKFQESPEKDLRYVREMRSVLQSQLGRVVRVKEN